MKKLLSAVVLGGLLRVGGVIPTGVGIFAAMPAAVIAATCANSRPREECLIHRRVHDVMSTPNFYAAALRTADPRRGEEKATAVEQAMNSAEPQYQARGLRSALGGSTAGETSPVKLRILADQLNAWIAMWERSLDDGRGEK